MVNKDLVYNNKILTLYKDSGVTLSLIKYYFNYTSI